MREPSGLEVERTCTESSNEKEREVMPNRRSSQDRESSRCSERMWSLAWQEGHWTRVLGPHSEGPTWSSEEFRDVLTVRGVQWDHSRDGTRKWCHHHHSKKITQVKGSSNTDGKEGEQAALLKINRWDLAADSKAEGVLRWWRLS